MTELLVIKEGGDYFRVKEGMFERGPLNKGSVFPLGRAGEAMDCCRRLRESGVAATLMKLTIVEEPYSVRDEKG